MISSSLFSCIVAPPEVFVLGTGIDSIPHRAVLALSVNVLKDTKAKLRIVSIRAEAPLNLTQAPLNLADDQPLSLLLETPQLAQRDGVDDAMRAAEEHDATGRLLEVRGVVPVRERDLGPLSLDEDALVGVVADLDEARGGLGAHEAHAGDGHCGRDVVGAWDDVDVAGVDVAAVGPVLGDGLEDHGLGGAIGEVPDGDAAVAVGAGCDGGDFWVVTVNNLWGTGVLE